MLAIAGEWWFDYSALAAFWLLSAGFLFGGYAMGGRAWSAWLDERILEDKSKGARFYGIGAEWLEKRMAKHGRLKVNGAWFELIVLTASVLTMALINFFVLPQAKIALVLQRHWWWLLPVTGAVYLTVAYFSRDVSRRELEKRTGKLAHDLAKSGRSPSAEQTAAIAEFATRYGRGYWIYNFYSTCLYTVFILGAAVVVSQMVADLSQFQVEHAALDAEEARVAQVIKQFEEVGSPSPEQASRVMLEVEKVYSRFAKALLSIAHQVNTVVLVAICTLALTFIIEFTPARNTYTDTGLAYMRVAVWISIGLVIGVGAWMYFGLYGDMIKNIYQRLDGFEETLRAKAPAASWDVLRRYTEIVNELRSRQGPSGFLRSVLTEQSILVTGLGLLQQFWLNRVRRNVKREAVIEAREQGLADRALDA